MKKCVKNRRRIALVGTYSLEDRVLLSTIGRSAVTQFIADIAKLPHPSHAVDHIAMTKAPLAARVANNTSRHPAAASFVPTARRWSWLANTYWYVPTTNLPAVLYNSTTGSLMGVSDQTV